MKTVKEKEVVETKDVEKEVLLEVKNLKKHFPVRGLLGRSKNVVKAVDDVSFKIYKGETYGIVGESGCGKSTTGRALLRLIEPTEGSAMYEGVDLFTLTGKERMKMFKDLQMVFQDPYSSLNPRQRIGHILEEPLKIHKIGTSKERTDIVMDILDKVGMRVDHYYRYPHELSGGQRQRIGLARAIVVNPKLIIADEPVSALDVSIQSQVLNLLQELQRDLGLTYMFIAHDISVVRHISDRIGVMYLGKIIEEAPTDELMGNPKHPYTQALLSAVPVANPEIKRERIILKGDLPSPLNPPLGCAFHTRCPFAMDICRKEMPVAKSIGNEHVVACHLE